MHTGTIVFGACRPAFALLAADSLYHAPDKPALTESKVWVHPTLALAVAVAGMRQVPEGGKRVIDTVREAAEALPTDATDLWTPLKANLTDRFAQDAMYTAALTEIDQGDFWKGKARVEVYAACMERGVGRLYSLTILPTGVWSHVFARSSVSGPGHVIDRFKAENPNGPGAFAGDTVDDRNAVIRRAREIIESGIAIDQEVMGEARRECGPPIELAVVDAAGARLIHV